MTSAAARKALRERDVSRPGLAAAWAVSLTPSQDLVWRKTLELFATLGRPPLLTEIARDLQVDDGEVRKLVLGRREHPAAPRRQPAVGVISGRRDG